MADNFTCDICGRVLKTAAGLAGHKQLVHSGAQAPLTGSPEVALSEMLGAVKESHDRLDQRMDNLNREIALLGNQFKSLHGKFSAFQDNCDASAKVAYLEDTQTKLADQMSTVEGFAELARATHIFDGEAGGVAFVNFANALGMGELIHYLTPEEKKTELAEMVKLAEEDERKQIFDAIQGHEEADEILRRDIAEALEKRDIARALEKEEETKKKAEADELKAIAEAFEKIEADKKAEEEQFKQDVARALEKNEEENKRKDAKRK